MNEVRCRFNYLYSLKYISFLLSKSSSQASSARLSLRLRLKLLSSLSTLSLVFAGGLLLSCSFGTQALSASTSKVIEGSAPYLTFDEGQTQVDSMDSLLSITLPDGQILSPSFNGSSVIHPIKLPYAGNTLGDIGMSIPSSVDSVSLNDLVNTYHYWGDADGDGSNGVTVTGNISVKVTDKDGNAVSRNDALDACKAPYRIILSSPNGSLTTQYGIPNTSYFKGRSVWYFISPYESSICYVRPNLMIGSYSFAGPDDIWNPSKGFLVQSTSPSSYSRNFPTTGADGLYFDLVMGENDESQLTWSPVTLGGITATVTWVRPNNSDDWLNDRYRSVARVTLSGPRADNSQIQSNNPSPLIPLPSLPQTFELVGKDGSGNVAVKYGFVLRQWFVNRGYNFSNLSIQTAWCSSLGYRMPQVKDLTNAKCGKQSDFLCVGEIDGAMPLSSHNHYQRQIGAGFFTEWGNMTSYKGPGFGSYEFWTSDASNSNGFSVSPIDGKVLFDFPEILNHVVCTVP
jgi:hypothetical protein